MQLPGMLGAHLGLALPILMMVMVVMMMVMMMMKRCKTCSLNYSCLMGSECQSLRWGTCASGARHVAGPKWAPDSYLSEFSSVF